MGYERKKVILQKRTFHNSKEDGTYKREPFIKKVYGEVRTFANRKEYKAFKEKYKNKKGTLVL